MINRIGISPAFKSTVVVDRSAMSKEKLELVDSDEFKEATDILSKNGCKDIIRIASTEDDDCNEVLSMDIIEDAGKGSCYVIHDKLASGVETRDMLVKHHYYSERKVPCFEGTFLTGARLSMAPGTLDDYLDPSKEPDYLFQNSGDKWLGLIAVMAVQVYDKGSKLPDYTQKTN